MFASSSSSSALAGMYFIVRIVRTFFIIYKFFIIGIIRIIRQRPCRFISRRAGMLRAGRNPGNKYGRFVGLSIMASIIRCSIHHAMKKCSSDAIMGGSMMVGIEEESPARSFNPFTLKSRIGSTLQTDEPEMLLAFKT